MQYSIMGKLLGSFGGCSVAKKTPHCQVRFKHLPNIPAGWSKTNRFQLGLGMVWKSPCMRLYMWNFALWTHKVNITRTTSLNETCGGKLSGCWSAEAELTKRPTLRRSWANLTSSCWDRHTYVWHRQQHEFPVDLRTYIHKSLNTSTTELSNS